MSGKKLSTENARTLPSNIHFNVVRHVQRIATQKEYVLLRSNIVPLSRFEEQEIIYKDRTGEKRKRDEPQTPERGDDDDIETNTTMMPKTHATPPLLSREIKNEESNSADSLFAALELELLFGDTDQQKQNRTETDLNHIPQSLWISDDD
jgi:hypothetical protein